MPGKLSDAVIDGDNMMSPEITDAQVAAARQAFKDSAFYSTRRVTPDDQTIRSMLRAAGDA